MRIEDLWRWEGTLDRGPYALVGVLGFAIKHNLDRFVAAAAFHRSWGIFNYWIPLGEAVRITSLSRRDAAFWPPWSCWPCRSSGWAWRLR